jgi:hypothetical protein
MYSSSPWKPYRPDSAMSTANTTAPGTSAHQVNGARLTAGAGACAAAPAAGTAAGCAAVPAAERGAVLACSDIGRFLRIVRRLD